MRTNQPGFTNIILIVIIVILIGAAGYFVSRQRQQNLPTNQADESTSLSDETSIKKPVDSNWKTYSKTNQWFGYSTKYPSDWSLKEFGTGEIGTGVYFLPPGETSEQKSIAIIIINYEKTPSLPVWYTYTALRKVKSGSSEILVQKREPGSEQYIATIGKGDYTAEFRFAHNLDSKYDSVFDHILSSFVWTK